MRGSRFPHLNTTFTRMYHAAFFTQNCNDAVVIKPLAVHGVATQSIHTDAIAAGPCDKQAASHLSQWDPPSLPSAKPPLSSSSIPSSASECRRLHDAKNVAGQTNDASVDDTTSPRQSQRWTKPSVAAPEAGFARSWTVCTNTCVYMRPLKT